MKLFIERYNKAFGWDGLTTFIFSNIVLLLTIGLGFVWLFLKVLRLAIKTQLFLSATEKTSTNTVDAILIAGLRLKNNQPDDEYKARLNRVISLLYRLKKTPEIIILGGVTGDSTISEAQAGADYLIKQGIKAEHIILEDQSQHTLENLQRARSILSKHTDDSSAQTIIISSRYHLYRILSLAKGMNMSLQPIAAEKTFSFSFLMLMRLLKEVYFLHWYWCGKFWVFINKNKHSHSRIS